MRKSETHQDGPGAALDAHYKLNLGQSGDCHNGGHVAIKLVTHLVLMVRRKPQWRSCCPAASVDLPTQSAPRAAPKPASDGRAH